MSLLRFHSTLTGNVAVVGLEGELDVAGAELVEREVDRLLADHAPATVVLDLSALDFMDSTGLRLVVVMDGRLRGEGRSLVLVRGADPVHKVFEITRMTERLRFVGSLSEVAT